MERLDGDLLNNVSLFNEHKHRYNFFIPHLSGVVVDCASGLGYAAELILANSEVEKYIGFDLSDDALEFARRKFGNKDKVQFTKGSIQNLPLSDNSVDCFLCLETLEHLESPKLAVLEISRVLKPDGIFCCSVPTAEYETACDSTYGANPYHIQRFEKQDIDELLRGSFDHLQFFLASENISTLIEKYPDSSGPQLEVIKCYNSNSSTLGSFMVLATRGDISLNVDVGLYIGQPKVFYDRDNLNPKVERIKKTEAMLQDRTELLHKTESIAEDRLRTIQDLEMLHKSRLESLREAEELAIQRFELMREAEKIAEIRLKWLGEASQRIEELEADILKNSDS